MWGRGMVQERSEKPPGLSGRHASVFTDSSVVADYVTVGAPQADELWAQLHADVELGIRNFLATESSPSDWDTVFGYDESYGIGDTWTDWGVIHQLTYVVWGSPAGDGCGLGDVAIHLYLYADGTLATVRVDSVTG